MQKATNFYIVQKKQSYTLILGAFYFFLLSGLLGCGNLAELAVNGFSSRLGVNVTSIRDIKLGQERNATIYLRGKVIKQVPLLGWRVYQLQDSTGAIWVLTNQTTPQPEDEVLIKAQVLYQSIPLVGKEFGEVYVEQQEQLERTPYSQPEKL